MGPMTQLTATDVNDDLEEALLEPKLSEAAVEEIKQKSLSGVVSFFIRTVILQGIGLVSTLVLSAFLSPSDFGVYGIVTQIIALLIFFSDIGLASSLIQKEQEPSKKDYQTAFSVQQLLSWLIFILVALMVHYDVFTGKIGQTGNGVLLALAFSFPLATLKTIPSIILERKLDFNKLVLPQIFEQIVFHVVLIVLAWRGHGIASYTYAVLARSIIGVAVMQIIQPWLAWPHINRQSLKTLLNFGVKFQLNDLLARIKDQLYFLALGAYLPLDQFGYLQWSKNWSMYPYNLTVSNVMSITFPTFSRLQGHKQVLKRAIEKSLYFISLFIFPLLLGMCVFIQPLTEVIARYAKWQPAIPSFILFTLSVAWAAISTPLTNALNAIGKINQTLKLMVFWTVLTWLLTPVLLWKFSYNGVALAAFLISFTSILSVLMIKKYMQIDIWQNVKVQLLSALIMAGAAYVTLESWSQSLPMMLSGVLLSALLYGLSLLVLGRQRLLAELKSFKKKT